jgi:hypothetical protein
MNDFRSIRDCAQHLIAVKSNITSDEFLTYCNWSILNMVPSTAREMMSWCEHPDEFCVNADDAFFKYGFNDIRNGSDIGRLIIDQLHMVRDEDYTEQFSHIENDGETYVRFHYSLTLDAFRRCLRRSGDPAVRFNADCLARIECCHQWYQEIEFARLC